DVGAPLVGALDNLVGEPNVPLDHPSDDLDKTEMNRRRVGTRPTPTTVVPWNIQGADVAPL
ncbi:MAG: hypothetical protein O3A14_06175, partial [Cyanobacteria bacterium]|nr:hypothetical protein [Cyanobacteriota bacterium]